MAGGVLCQPHSHGFKISFAQVCKLRNFHAGLSMSFSIGNGFYFILTIRPTSISLPPNKQGQVLMPTYVLVERYPFLFISPSILHCNPGDYASSGTVLLRGHSPTQICRCKSRRAGPVSSRGSRYLLLDGRCHGPDSTGSNSKKGMVVVSLGRGGGASARYWNVKE